MMLVQQRKSHQSMPNGIIDEVINRGSDLNSRNNDPQLLNDDLLNDLGCSPSRLGSINASEPPAHQRVHSMINQDGSLRLDEEAASAGNHSEQVGNFGLASNKEAKESRVGGKRMSQDGASDNEDPAKETSNFGGINPQ